MKLSNYRIKKHLGAKDSVPYSEKGLKETILKAKAAFYENEAEDSLSPAEFLYTQSKYIHTRWWFMQAFVLLTLWVILKISESSLYIQRSMGIMAPVFAVLLLPELWKSQNSGTVEVECAAYYPLHQIYAARIFLSAMVDLFLLTFFSVAAIASGKVIIEEIVINFFLPYIVTCCICFHSLYNTKIHGEAFALTMCMAWCSIWTLIVSNEKVYGAVSYPTWLAITAISALYLGYCIFKGQRSFQRIWETEYCEK